MVICGFPPKWWCCEPDFTCSFLPSTRLSVQKDKGRQQVWNGICPSPVATGTRAYVQDSASDPGTVTQVLIYELCVAGPSVVSVVSLVDLRLRRLQKNKKQKNTKQNKKTQHIKRALSFLLCLILLLSSNMFQCIETEGSVGENEFFILERAEYFERNCKNNSM